MEEILTSGDIARMSGTWVHSTTQGNTSECLSKSEVEATFTNVTVGGGVASNELVSASVLTVSTKTYFCRWTYPDSTVTIGGYKGALNTSHAISYYYEGNGSHQFVLPQVKDLPSWLKCVNIEKGDYNYHFGETLVRLTFETTEENTTGDIRTGQITVYNPGASSTIVTIQQYGGPTATADYKFFFRGQNATMTDYNIGTLKAGSTTHIDIVSVMLANSTGKPLAPILQDSSSFSPGNVVTVQESTGNPIRENSNMYYYGYDINVGSDIHTGMQNQTITFKQSETSNVLHITFSL